MNKELEALKTIIGVIAYVDLRDLDRKSIDNALETIETTLKRLKGIENMAIFLNKELQKAKKKIFNLEKEIAGYKCQEFDKKLFKNKLKVLEIIKEKPIVALIDYRYTYEEWLELVDEKDRDLFKNKEEYDLLKEVLK